MHHSMFKGFNFVWQGLTQHLYKTYPRNIMFPVKRYCSTPKAENEEELDSHSLIYKDTTSEYGTGKKYAVAKLQQLFNIRQFTAADIATRFKKLQLVTGNTISNNYQLLKKEGVPDEIILQYPDVLAQKQIEEKFLLLKNLPFHLSETIPLLNIEINNLKEFISKEAMEYPHVPGGHIGHLSRLLKLSVIETCYVVTRRTFLRNIDLVKAETNLKLLLDFGITIDEIKRDYWVLKYNNDFIKQRLEQVKSRNVDKIKTWMVRAQSEIFNTYIQRRSENKLILGESSLVEYLSQRLECTPDQAKIILEKHPALPNKSMRKMKEIIDFLYADGFQPSHIVRNPKILLHSEETTRKRLKELEAQGMKVDSLHILTKSQKQYMQYYENLVKTKNKIKSET